MEIKVFVALFKKLICIFTSLIVFLLFSLFIGPASVYARIPCEGGIMCGGRCIDVSSDNNNCGDCGVNCDQGTTCSGGMCVAAGPGGGTTCGGCQPNYSGFGGLGQINNVWFTNQTVNSFTVNWTRDSGGCGNKSDNVVFIGTDKDVVNSNCFDCGAGFPGNNGYGADCTNKNYGSSNLPPGCLAERIVPMGTSSFNTAGSVTLDPTKNYYVKVVGWVHFTRTLASGQEEDVNDLCSNYPGKPFLGMCTTNSVPPNTPMSVGAPPQLFQTNINVPNNTITYTNPIVTNISFPTVQVIDPNDGTKSHPRTGLLIKGYRFGTGRDRLTIQNFPTVNYLSMVTHRDCTDERPPVCTTVTDGENVYLSDPGPGPVQVYIYNHLAGTTALSGNCINNGYPCSQLDHFFIPCNNTTAPCPPQSSITIGPYTSYNNLVPVSNSPFFGTVTSDSISVPNYVWDFSHYTFTYAPGSGTPPAPFYAIDKVGYYPTNDNPPYISIENSAQYPNPDPTAPYQTLVTALRNGVTNMTTKVFAQSVADPPACTSTNLINISGQTEAWWQTKDSDIQADGGVQSKVPSGNFFGLPGPGTYPGVVAYQNNATFAPGSVSEIGWLASSPWSNAKRFDYSYFSNVIPTGTPIKDITSGDLSGATPDSNDYEWYRYDGSLNGGLPLKIDNAITVDRKIILLVKDAKLQVNANISNRAATGFFMAIVNGNIEVSPNVTNLVGLYVADGTFSDGTNQPAVDSQLSIVGSVAAYGGVDLQRDLLSGNSAPAELFTYDPSQILLFPTVLGYRKINWKEVAP